MVPHLEILEIFYILENLEIFRNFPEIPWIFDSSLDREYTSFIEFFLKDLNLNGQPHYESFMFYV